MSHQNYWVSKVTPLDYYYFLVSGIQVVNLVYYFICAWFYTYKSVEEISEKNKEEDLEQANEHVSSDDKLNDGKEEEKRGLTKDEWIDGVDISF